MEDRTYQSISFVQAIAAIKTISKRIAMLGSNKWTPDDAKIQLKIEKIALELALSTLQNNIAHVLIAVGHKKIIESALTRLEAFKALDRVTKTDEDSDITCLLMVEPTAEMSEECIRIFNPDNWEGSVLEDDRVLDFITCKRYFAASNGDDRSLLFELDIDKDSVNRIEDLQKWTSAIFNNVTWGEETED